MAALRFPRLKFSLAGVVTAVVGLSVISIALISLRTVYDQKLRDSEAIVFLLLERQSEQVASYVAKMAAAVDPEGADLAFQVSGTKLLPIRGEVTRALSLRDIGVDRVKELQDFSVIGVAGRTYLARANTDAAGAERLSLWRLQLTKAGGWPSPGQQTVAYVANRQGQTVFDSSGSNDSVSLIKRELVQKFIAAPIRQGQLKFKNEDGRTVTGFYQEVAATNLVLFTESTLNPAWAATVGAIRSVVFAGTLILLVAAGVLQWLLHAHGRALRRFSAEVIRALDRPEVGAVELPTAVELVPLANAFNFLMATRQVAAEPSAKAELPESEAS